MSKPIINGIDVSECNAYKDKHCKDKTSIMFTEYNLCSNFSDCYFKQLKRLQEENEELKEKIDIYENSIIANHDRAVGKRLMEVLQTLEEIREIAKEATNSKDCYIYMYAGRMYCEPILNKINEVLEDSEDADSEHI